MSLFFLYFAIISVVFILWDLLIARASFAKKEPAGKYLGLTCIGAAAVALFYFGTTVVENYFVYSVLSSLYFLSVDVMLVAFVMFSTYFTKRKLSDKGVFFNKIGVTYLIFDIIVLLVNPFYEWAVTYTPRATEFAKFSYEMHGLFYGHLAFCYMMVLTVVCLFVQKFLTVPREYRRQYLYSVIGVAAVVLINAVFLFVPGLHVYSFLDYAIFGYSIAAYVLYWSCFNYSITGMLDLFKMSIFENLDQGLVLFDYENNMILHNEMAARYLPNVKLENRRNMEQFIKDCNFILEDRVRESSFALQFYSERDGEKIPLRCDYKVVRNAKQKIIGRLFMFSDAHLSTDILTGFQNWDGFKFYATEHKQELDGDFFVCVGDISQLSFINSTRGHQYGDKKIKELADLGRKYFPKDSYFVRGQDAYLIAFIAGVDNAEVEAALKNMERDFDLHFQYSWEKHKKGEDIFESIETAVKGVKQKKLLDKGSAHSAILSSLVRALEECDSDTEEHVQRTQQMGAALGKRIGLTDVQLSDLSLLCLLHDIGKIGVPLEILNKPGKLTNEEWESLRSHAEKGYQIANSSPELERIADMVLHHHERWDGAGYPAGLSKEAIPLLSRIIAVVDAYDAMVNDRSYRPALPEAKAREELRRCAGSQFDPGIVSEFLQLLEDTLLNIKRNVKIADSAEAEALVRAELEMDTASAAPSRNVHKIGYCRYILDEEMYIIGVDNYFEHLTGYTEADVKERKMRQSDLLPAEDRMEYTALVMDQLSKKPQAYLEHRVLCKDGSIIYVLCYGKRFFDSAVRAGRSEIIFVNITETYAMRVMAGAEREKFKKREARLEKISRRDPLTGILNRSAFRNDVEEQLVKDENKVMLLMLDVDHFKEYNDTYGHHAGDEFLTLIAQSISSALRSADIAGRLGGDEFAAALFFKKECENDFMYERAQQIFDKINMTLKVNAKHDSNASLSMGAMISNEKLNTFNELYEAADKALYNSKENGRNRFSVGG